MAEHIRGTIQYVPEPRTSFNKKYYSIKVNDVYYSVGNKQPPEAGVLVEFDAEPNGKYWNVSKAGLSVVKAGETTQAVAQGAVSAAQTATMPREDYWRRKDDRDIEWQKHQKEVIQPRIDLSGCRNSAIEFVKLLLTPIQTKEGLEILMQVPAKAKRVEFIEKLVDEYTAKFVTENNKKNETKDEVTVTEPSIPVDSPVNSDDAVWDA